VTRHYADATRSPSMLRHLTEVLRRCAVGASACEVGCGSGYSSAWLSLRGVAAEGLASSPEAVERARQANNILAGKASFNRADPLEFGGYRPGRHCAVIHHRGLLHRYGLPEMRALLAQQVIRADRSPEFSPRSTSSIHFDGTIDRSIDREHNGRRILDTL